MDPRTYIQQRGAQYGVDPRALIAIAMGEGGLRNRANDIGDLSGGGSYGPFQMYAQGALPKQYRGNRQAADNWAWSEQGIDYALRGLSKYGRGKKGYAAIKAMIEGFERPRDPRSSIAHAAARYGGIGGGAPNALTTQGAPSFSGENAKQAKQQFAMNLISAMQQPEGNRGASLMGAIMGLRRGMESGDPQQLSLSAMQGAMKGGQLDLRAAIAMARKMGLRAGENALTGNPADPGVHVANSYHYKNQAIDVSGSAKAMRQYADWIRRSYGSSITELFAPGGVSIKNGRPAKIVPGHEDHVHFAYPH